MARHFNEETTRAPKTPRRIQVVEDDLNDGGYYEPAARTEPREGAAAPWPLAMSFFSSVLLMVLALVLTVAFTVGSGAFMQRMEKKSDYAEEAYALLSINYESYAGASGFPKEVLLDQVTLDAIDSEMAESIAAIYSGEEIPERDVQAIYDSFYNAMLDYAGEINYKVTDDTKEAIAAVAESCRNSYTNFVGFPAAKTLQSMLDRLQRVIWIAAAVVAVLAAISLFLTFLLAGKKATGLRFLAFSTITSAVASLIFAFVLFPAFGLGRITINPASMAAFLQTYLRGIFTAFVYPAIAFAIISAILIVLSIVLRSKERRGHAR